MTSKYGAKKTFRILGGEKIEFDSLKEAKRFDVLYLLLKAKQITKLTLQPSYTLQDGFRDKIGKKHRPITYVADFKYTKDGVEVVEDTKGFKTEVYRIKKKLLLHKFPSINFIET